MLGHAPSFLRKNARFFLLAFLVVVNVSLLYWYKQLEALPHSTQADIQVQQMPEHFPEIEELQQMQSDFPQLSAYFQNVAEQKGSLYAWNLLRVAPIPPNIDVHLLGHLIGDEMYKEYGFEAIRLCTDDFRNACSHTVVIGLFLEEGLGALEKITQACEQAPGGRGAYGMCFHGVGHGVLAFSEYNLEEAVELCKKMKGSDPMGREDVECIGGTIMEMNAGIHDREAWEKQWKNYYSDVNPLSPCDREFMPENARSICYVYHTPRLFISAGGQLGNPSDAAIEKAFTYCSQLPANQKEFASDCYGGFGKEFVTLAQERDIRGFEQMSDAKMQRVVDWCSLAGTQDGEKWCVTHAVNSMYWGGENSPEPAVRLCALVQAGEPRDSCFAELLQSVSYYAPDRVRKEEYCSFVPEEYTAACQLKLL